ncbi:MAG: glutaredoxin family protein [Thermaerobacter sp.]|nr:glutaredoxin family protein [Thermaerobacter sp.]
MEAPASGSLGTVLLTKEDCSLCDKAKAALTRIARDLPLDIRVVKVDGADPRATRVPIVEIEGVEVQAGKVSEFRLRNWLKERGFHNATR